MCVLGALLLRRDEMLGVGVPLRTLLLLEAVEVEECCCASRCWSSGLGEEDDSWARGGAAMMLPLLLLLRDDEELLLEPDAAALRSAWEEPLLLLAVPRRLSGIVIWMGFRGRFVPWIDIKAVVDSLGQVRSGQGIVSLRG